MLMSEEGCNSGVSIVLETFTQYAAQHLATPLCNSAIIPLVKSVGGKEFHTSDFLVAPAKLEALWNNFIS